MECFVAQHFVGFYSSIECTEIFITWFLPQHLGYQFVYSLIHYSRNFLSVPLFHSRFQADTCCADRNRGSFVFGNIFHDLAYTSFLVIKLPIKNRKRKIGKVGSINNRSTLNNSLKTFWNAWGKKPRESITVVSRIIKSTFVSDFRPIGPYRLWLQWAKGAEN